MQAEKPEDTPLEDFVKFTEERARLAAATWKALHAQVSFVPPKPGASTGTRETCGRR